MSENDEEKSAVEPEGKADVESDAETEDTTAEAPASEAEETPRKVEQDDFVRLEYTMRTVEGGRLVDTTDEEIGEEEGIDTTERDFGPRAFVVGSGQLFAAVENDLTGKAVGEGGTVTIPAEEAFGEYDPEEVRTISADRLPEDDRQPGSQVTVDGEQGFVETVIGGRARVDFNHPLAGDDIEYNYEVVGFVEDRLEQAEELLATYLDMRLDVSIGLEEEEEIVYDEEAEEETTETVEYETLYIEATPQLTMNQQWMFSKQQIADDLRGRIGVDRVVVRDVIEGGMMGGMGGIGSMGGDMDEEDIESAIEEADLDEDVDADEVVEELETGADEE